MKSLKKIACCLLGIILSVFLLTACQEKPAKTEEPEPVPGDTDWTFEEGLPCGWFFYIQEGCETWPNGDFSDENAMYAYLIKTFDENYQIYTYKTLENNLDSFAITKEGISSNNGTEFASLTLEATFYYTAILTPYNNKAGKPINPYFFADYVIMDTTTRELSLTHGLSEELIGAGKITHPFKKEIRATRIHNGQKETTAVSIDLKISAEMLDDLLQAAVIEYTDNGEEIKRTIVDKTNTNEYGGINFDTAKNTAYVIVEREWEVPFDGMRENVNAGDTYKTREVLKKNGPQTSTTLWYPTDSGLCDGKSLRIVFPSANE